MTNIAILGFGNIGSGVAKVIARNKEKISETIGDDIFVKYILDKRDLAGTGYEDRAVRDFEVILNDPSVSVVCETMGGTQPAFDFSMAALKAGKSVVTSNKEVVARFGIQLLQAARENQVHYLYEASVGGAIPILHAFDDSLKATNVKRIDGILNGTTNYILTRMHDCSSTFEDALDEARRLGYAEANPTADISGADTCRKLCILAAVTWGGLVSNEDVYCEGITEITSEHNDFAAKCGGSVKLVATALKNDDSLYLAVSPCVVMNENPLSSAKGVFNAIKVDAGDFGDMMFYGMGAGKLPTASAVVTDIIAAVCRGKDTDRYCFFRENQLPLAAYAATAADYCVAVKADRETIAAKIQNHCLLKEEEGTWYVLCEGMTKDELEKALAGLDVLMLMRAIV